MESDITQSELFAKLWVWGDKNKKQLLYGLIALAVVGMVVAFWLAHQNEKQNDANDALSQLTSRGFSPSASATTPQELLKIATDYPDTDAAQRALLLAAGDLFASGKYDEAQAQFQKFQQQYNSSPLVPQAALGVAACYDALGKTNDAVDAYQNIVDRYQTQNVFLQAKLSLANLLEAQGKFKEAKTHLEDLTRSYPGTISSEAASRLHDLSAAHPELMATNAPRAVIAPGIVSTNLAR
jgi:TolA-binding protein